MGKRVASLLRLVLVVVAGCTALAAIGFPGAATGGPRLAQSAPPRVAAVDAAAVGPDVLRASAGPRAPDLRALDELAASAGMSGATWSPAHLAAPPATATPSALPAWVRRYHGAAHVWMPTLGLSRQVWVFPCSRGRSPDNLVYRWGCAGTNNVYLLGHAWGVFQALHDAYYNGKLKVGMPVIYADARGKVRLYRVTRWQVVSPVKVAWAIASQPVPSLTLQTCIGPGGRLRLNVRLVEAFK